MAKFLYTISNHAQVCIDDPGSMCLNVQHWLSHTKFFHAQDISFAQKLFELEGIRCKLRIYYVYELLDSCSTVCFRAAAYSSEEAKALLFSIIPKNYIAKLKNPDFSNDARSVITRYQSNETF